MAKDIDEILDIEPYEVTRQEKKTEIIPAQKEDEKDKEFEKDFIEAKQSILQMMDMSKDVSEKLYGMAVESEDTRAYDSLERHIKNVMHGADKLMDLYRKKYDAENKKTEVKMTQDNSVQTVNIENAVITGSTKDILKKLKNKDKEE